MNSALTIGCRCIVAAARSHGASSGAISAPTAARVAGLVIVLAVLLMALFAPWLAPYAPDQTNNTVFLKPPLWQAGGAAAYLLGTDAIGRDMLSRLIYGARLSLVIGLAVVALSVLAGTVLGLIGRVLSRRLRDRDHAADGHHPDAAQPAAGDRDRGHPRPGPDERDAGGRRGGAAALRAHHARGGDLRSIATTTSPPRAWPAPATCA